MPSQSVIGVSADQFSVAVPASASRDSSSASQSRASPGWSAPSATAPPETQGLVLGAATADSDQRPAPGVVHGAHLHVVLQRRPPISVIVYSRSPSVSAVHAPSTTVQPESTVSSASVSMWRTS